MLNACYFLLIARSFLLVARYFSVQITLKQNYCEPQNNGLTIMNSSTDILHANFWDFDKFFWLVIFKIFSTCKIIFKVDIKSHILPQLIALWCFYYNITITMYYNYFHELEESEVVAQKSCVRKVFLKIPQIHRKISVRGFLLQ